MRPCRGNAKQQRQHLHADGFTAVSRQHVQIAVRNVRSKNSSFSLSTPILENRKLMQQL